MPPNTPCVCNGPTQLNPTTGKHHPKKSESGYVSKFPLDFNGCFHCDFTEHFKSLECPVVVSGQSKKRFYLMNSSLVNHN